MQILRCSKDKHEVLAWQNQSEQAAWQGRATETGKDGGHCITVWECELKPKAQGKTLEALAYTLNHIYLEDHSLRYKLPEEELLSEMAAEPTQVQHRTAIPSAGLA